MRLAVVRILLTCAALSIPLILLAAVRSGGSPFASTPAEVIIEGVVVPGDTYRIEPIAPEELASAAGGVAAEIRITNRHGEVVRAEADSSGRFRVGPIEVSGDEKDVLLVSSPLCRTLSMSCLIPAEVRGEPGAAGPRTVLWKIVLPRRPGGAEPVG